MYRYHNCRRFIAFLCQAKIKQNILKNGGYCLSGSGG
jgi:hypothetical protein